MIKREQGSWVGMREGTHVARKKVVWSNKVRGMEITGQVRRRR